MRFCWKALAIIPATLFPLYILAFSNEAAIPVPQPVQSDPEVVALGKALFSDPLFSQDNSLACASCHSLKTAGVDGLIHYRGLDQKFGDLNTPTVFNASLNTSQFWDGRAADLKAVIEDHLEDKTIFNNTWTVVIDRIKEDNDLKKQFSKAFSGKINSTTITAALVSYLNTLLTPDSPFDRYLNGDQSALSADALKGYQLFVQYGCITCHQGPNLGGNLYQRMGIYGDYFAKRGNLTQADLGRYNVTGKESDRYVFKVPGLRNVALTGPYLHDGQAATLEEVVALMGIYEVGQPIPNFDIPFIVKFLESLTAPSVSSEKTPNPEPSTTGQTP